MNRKSEKNIGLNSPAGRLRRSKPDAMPDYEWVEKLGISSTMWSTYINGHAPASLKVLTRISELTGLSLDWLVFGKGPPQGGFDMAALRGAIRVTMRVMEAAWVEKSTFTAGDYLGILVATYEENINEVEQAFHSQGSETPKSEASNDPANVKPVSAATITYLVTQLEAVKAVPMHQQRIHFGVAPYLRAAIKNAEVGSHRSKNLNLK